MSIVLAVIAGLLCGIAAAWPGTLMAARAAAANEPAKVKQASVIRTVTEAAALVIVVLLRNWLPLRYDVMLICMVVAMSLFPLIFTFRYSAGGKL